jgi:signal peptidase I
MDNSPPRPNINLESHSLNSLPVADTATDWDDAADFEPQAQSVPVRSVIKELLETAIFILLVFFIMRGMVQNFKIEGSSMEPSLQSGQYILVNKLIYFHFDINAPLRLLPGMDDIEQRIIYPFRPPQRGDIIVFEYPRDVSKDYIKRVIGLPGDTVEMRKGEVYVNGSLLDETYLEGMQKQTFCNSPQRCAAGPVVVPPGSVFVMGDHRTNSSDSREWDALSLERVIGQAWLLYFPLQDWGVVEHYTYASDQANQN